MSAYKNCQSCGMPMKKDTMGGGTNADGSKNEMYCSNSLPRICRPQTCSPWSKENFNPWDSRDS